MATEFHGYRNLFKTRGLPEMTPYQMAEDIGRSYQAKRDVTFGSSAPSSGTHTVGSIVYNTAPTAGGNIGWVCTTGGTPGTWKAFGAIDA